MKDTPWKTHLSFCPHSICPFTEGFRLQTGFISHMLLFETDARSKLGSFDNHNASQAAMGYPRPNSTASACRTVRDSLLCQSLCRSADRESSRLAHAAMAGNHASNQCVQVTTATLQAVDTVDHALRLRICRVHKPKASAYNCCCREWMCAECTLPQGLVAPMSALG